MGIPSYYKKLADHTKGLVSKHYEGKPSALYFDFNCMIYHCARRQNSTLPPYPGPEGNEEWERLLLDDIVKYVVKVWQTVGQPKEVFLAVDGVVPMAKIKQQRMRRFKSIWLAEEEKKEGTRENKPSWDTNCITPGTHFMKRLSVRLQELCAKRPHWSISGAEEPGEGEHKVMAKLRQREASEEPIFVYGLDADLILLTMLNAKSPAYLVREDSEMGLVQLNSFGEEDYSFFSLETLKRTLPLTVNIPTYVAAMSLLGNDFLPHSLTLKIRENGHETLVKSLKSLAEANIQLLTEKDSIVKINHEALLTLFAVWSQEEQSRMLHALKKKLQMRGRSQECLENRPLEWMVESGLVWKDKETWILHSQWKEVYTKQWLKCERDCDVDSVCQEYIFGIQWVLDYYTGQHPVNMLWSFSRLVPPLWSHLESYCQKNLYKELQFVNAETIKPSEQLAMVLPLESWHLLQEPSLRSLPSRLPQFWPTSFEFFSAGRTRMWECEPLIPALPVQRIRSAMNSAVKPKGECVIPK
jgi:5'-3' exonuclease